MFVKRKVLFAGGLYMLVTIRTSLLSAHIISVKWPLSLHEYYHMILVSQVLWQTRSLLFYRPATVYFLCQIVLHVRGWQIVFVQLASTSFHHSDAIFYCDMVSSHSVPLTSCSNCENLVSHESWKPRSMNDVKCDICDCNLFALVYHFHFCGDVIVLQMLKASLDMSSPTCQVLKNLLTCLLPAVIQLSSSWTDTWLTEANFIHIFYKILTITLWCNLMCTHMW
jgi:hypothetical protein